MKLVPFTVHLDDKTREIQIPVREDWGEDILLPDAHDYIEAIKGEFIAVEALKELLESLDKYSLLIGSPFRNRVDEARERYYAAIRRAQEVIKQIERKNRHK